MLSKTAVVAAGVCSTLFIGYCVYFDRKRRNDPKFKQLLKEKRAKSLRMKEQSKKPQKLPELRDYEAVQKYFIQEVQMGEELLAQGDIENGIEHLSTALAICGEPAHLLDVLQQQLPPPVFQLLMQRLPIVSQKIVTSLAAQRLQEEDVE